VRVMMMIKGDREPGHLPSEEFLAQMGKYNEELSKAGVLLDLAALHWSAEGVRVKFSAGKRTVIDGPFGEAKEIVAGYWILQCSRWTRPSNGPSGSRLRPVVSPRPRGRSRSVSCSSWTSSVRARRSNEGPAREGAAQEEGVTTSDRPSGDRRGLEGG
jgi:hypothetical protein